MKLSHKQIRRMYSHPDPYVDDDADFWPMMGVLAALLLIWTGIIHLLDWLTFDTIPLWAEPFTITPVMFGLVMFENFRSINPMHWWPLLWGYKVKLPEDHEMTIYNDEDKILKKHGGRKNVYVIDNEHIKFRKKKDAVIFGLRYF